MYYKLLDFKIEPFSNSPDPRLFYRSQQHLEVLQKLEISIRLKRGLNVVIGDIGTGKTTVSRQLIQELSKDTAIEYYLILDPGFTCVHGFLSHILYLLIQKTPDKDLDENHLKEQIKIHLFTRGVDENTNTVLVIDEGQKLSLDCLEVLRELLNFETNAQKLLQIVIFAQNEFDYSLEKVKNFQDRISFRYNLKVLNFKESKGLIQYRLNQSFVQGKQRPVFSAAAFVAIYTVTKGSPRKIINLCHQVIITLIIKDQEKAGLFLVRSCAKKMAPPKRNKSIPILLAGGLLTGILFLGILLTGGDDPGHLARPFKAPQLNLYPVPGKIPGPVLQEIPVPVPGEVPAPVLQETLAPATGEISVPTANEPPPVVLHKGSSKIYGSILVPEQATIYRMISLVYGRFSPDLLHQVMAYNNTISAPDRLLSGFPIRFPVFREEKAYPDPAIFLLILQTRDFNRAFTEAASSRYQDIDVRILPFQYRDNGFVFNVIIDKSFESKEKALAFLKTIKPGIAAIPEDVGSLKTNGLTNKG